MAGGPAIPTPAPLTLDVSGRRYERLSRYAARVERCGASAPDLAGNVIVAEYTDGGDGRVVLFGAEHETYAWQGDVLREGSFDVYPPKDAE
jgi:hypothetical protein